MKILVIEDEPSELKLAHLVLSDAGHSVSGLDAADEAQAAILLDRPELILLDMSLPGIDGLAFVRKLKADPATCDIQVVAVTSYPEKYTKEEAMEAGCDVYLVKPVSTRELPTIVKDAVRQAGPSDRI